MRKITKKAVDAFYNATKFKKNNTEIEVLPNVTIMKLCGNEIAYRYNNPGETLMITSAGYETSTTKERLNGIIGVNIHQFKGQWYLNGEKWDGELVEPANFPLSRIRENKIKELIGDE